MTREADPALRRVVAAVAAFNPGVFGIGLAVALTVGPVALLAGCIDVLVAASAALPVLLGLGWSLGARQDARRERA